MALQIHKGSWFGLPDLGITEAIGNLFGAPRTSQGGSNLIGSPKPAAAPPQQNFTPAPQFTPAPRQSTAPAPAQRQPSPGGGGGQPQPQPQQPSQPQQPTYDPEAEIRRQQEEEKRRVEEQQRVAREAIGSAYEPIFSELDRQAGLLPGQRGEFETQVQSLATSQVGQVGREEARRVEELEALKPQEEERAKETLRGLEQDVRDILQASSLYFGAKGAADSSAPGVASELITREAQRARAKVLSTRNQSLSAIDQKVQEVKDISTDQLSKIDEWKSTKLFETSQWASNRLSELNTEKAQASGKKAEAIANLIVNTQEAFIQRLRQLDDAVTNYKSSVSLWQQQRQADLEDYRTKLSIASQYTSNTPGQYKIVTDAFGRTFAVNPQNPSDVQEISGTLTPGQLGVEEKEQPEGLRNLFNIGPTVE